MMEIMIEGDKKILKVFKLLFQCMLTSNLRVLHFSFCINI